MTTTVTLPLWLLALIAFLAAWAALDRFLVPSVRWFVRRRMAHVIDELNTRLELEIPAFNLTKRRVLIDRLLYDPAIVEAAGETAASGAVPRQVVMASVERYAREIVPASTPTPTSVSATGWRAVGPSSYTACGLDTPMTLPWRGSMPMPRSCS